MSRAMHCVGAGLRGRMIALGAVMLAAYAAAAVFWAGDAGAAVAATLAAVVCWVSATTALWMSHALRDPSYGLAAVLLPMAVRTGLPLMLALLIRAAGRGLVEAGFVYYLIGFYLLAWAVETLLSLAGLKQAWGWKSNG